MARTVGQVATTLAKKGAKAAGRKIAHKARGGCPGSGTGKHRTRTERMAGGIITYCINAGCGQVM